MITLAHAPAQTQGLATNGTKYHTCTCTCTSYLALVRGSPNPTPKKKRYFFWGRLMRRDASVPTSDRMVAKLWSVDKVFDLFRMFLSGTVLYLYLYTSISRTIFMYLCGMPKKKYEKEGKKEGTVMASRERKRRRRRRRRAFDFIHECASTTHATHCGGIGVLTTIEVRAESECSLRREARACLHTAPFLYDPASLCCEGRRALIS